jgi:3'-phosphoadenosine 5'-phosphosulfate sulfotransferase (PAPS reductase)/FAD synthetase
MADRRLVCWFSCGATSAVAAKLALEEARGMETHVCYCDTGSEHPSNEKFLRDVSAWLDHPITILKSERFSDIWDVFKKTRWLVGPKGARCTVELKKELRVAFSRPDDLHVFGYDASERKRVARFRENNFELDFVAPLLERRITKADCLRRIEDAGIELPEMYRLGYPNNNCIGCVKGQQGYWNKIRVDFPAVFERMAKVERELDVAINKSYAGDKKRKRVFLDELDPDAGRGLPMGNFSCGAMGCAEQLELLDG